MRRFIAAAVTLAFTAPLAAGRSPGALCIYEVTRTIVVRNQGTVDTVNFVLYTTDVGAWQNSLVIESDIDPEPAERSVQEDGMTVLAMPLRLKPGEERRVRCRWTLSLRDLDVTGERRCGGPPARVLARCLRPSLLIESDDPAIIAASARASRPGSAGEFQRVAAIVSFVRTHLSYRRLAEYRGARYALQTRTGDSLEYAALTAALCRAAGIPARVNGILLMREDEGTSRYENHFNAEAFVTPWGWIPLEPFFDQGGAGRLLSTELVVRRGYGDDSATTPLVSLNVPAKHRGRITAEVTDHAWKRNP